MLPTCRNTTDNIALITATSIHVIVACNMLMVKWYMTIIKTRALYFDFTHFRLVQIVLSL
jgi:uncharacterized membrane protein